MICTITNMRTQFFVASILLVLMLMAPSQQETIDEYLTRHYQTSDRQDYFSSQHGRINGPCKVIVELDMVFSCEDWAEIQRINNSYASGSRKKRGIRLASLYYPTWLNNIVYYWYQQGFSDDEKDMIRSAMDEWSEYTCISFQESNSAFNKVLFERNASGCDSYVGMQHRNQTVNLSPRCLTRKTAIHELGHVLGMHHEHQSPEYYQYLNINWRNIYPLSIMNFRPKKWRLWNNLGIPYDYHSIMHYTKTAGGYYNPITRQTMVTITTKDPRYQDIIGKAIGPSFRDIKMINIIYNCKRAQSNCRKNDDDCPGEGFVGKDCRCWCPNSFGVYKICGSAGGGGGFDCIDRGRNCSYWASRGHCFEPSLFTNCKRSCNINNCSSSIPCIDFYPQCASWASSGKCLTTSEYHSFMQSDCRRSCNFNNCAIHSSTCYDSDSNCAEWAKSEYCDHNTTNVSTDMTNKCTRSCTMCALSSSNCIDRFGECEYWASLGYCDSSSVYSAYMNVNCKRSCHSFDNCSLTNTWLLNNNCEDVHVICSQWAKDGECSRSSSRRYMSIYCQRSCKLCGDCKDLHVMCSVWAVRGSCNHHYSYMSVYCRRSCNFCGVSLGEDARNAIVGVHGGIGSAAWFAESMCEDQVDYCEEWELFRSCNHMDLQVNCRRTCNVNNCVTNWCQDEIHNCAEQILQHPCFNDTLVQSHCRRTCNVNNCAD